MILLVSSLDDFTWCINDLERLSHCQEDTFSVRKKAHTMVVARFNQFIYFMDPIQNQTPEGGAPSPATTTPQQSTTVGTEKNTLMGVLAYLGVLVLVPLFVAKDEPFVKYHIKQGLVLFVVEAGLWFVGGMMYILYPLIMIVNIACIVLSIIGIINVVKGEEKELPVVGKFSHYFKI